MTDEKTYSANEVLIILDSIQSSLVNDKHIEAYEKIKTFQYRLVKERDG